MAAMAAGDARMAGIQGARLVQQPAGLGGLARLDGLPGRGEELEHVGLRLHPLLGEGGDALELGVRADRGVLLHGRRHHVVEAPLVQQGLPFAPQVGRGRRGAEARVGQQIGQVQAQAVEIRERIGGRRRALEVVHMDRAGAGLEAVLEDLGGLEERVHPQHEIAAEERFLPVALPGQRHRLVESAEDPLLDVGRQRRITGVAHLGKSSRF